MSKKLSQVSVALMFSPAVINGKFQCLRRNSKTFRKRKQILFFFFPLLRKLDVWWCGKYWKCNSRWHRFDLPAFPPPNTDLFLVVILDASKVFELISPSRHHDDETFENRSSARKIPKLFLRQKTAKTLQ